MGRGKRVGAVVSALLAAAGGGAILAVATHPSPATTAPTERAAATSPADGVAPSARRAGAGHVRAPGAKSDVAKTLPRTTTTTTLPAPGPGFTQASMTNRYEAELADRLAPVRHADPGCILVTQGKTLLYQSNATVPLVPGSTEKLLVAAAALDVLGPNYTYTTEVLAPAAPVRGAVSGLWVVGGGDPVLEEPRFDAWRVGQPRYRDDVFTNVDTLAAAVRAKGVTTVTGGVHGDDARYDSQRLNPYWPSYTEADGDINPLSALTLNMDYAYWLAGPSVVPPDPASYAAGRFAQLLHSIGVNAAPGADALPPAGSVVIASIQSPPLWEIIRGMLSASDNQIAELLLKEIGYHATGHGTTAAGLAVVKAVDTRLGIPWTGTVMYDGSGLSHYDRTTCRTLLGAFYLGDKPGFTALRDVSVAGETGTMADRFLDPPLQGHLLAKTGSVDGAASMVGEIDLSTPVRFAVVFNQPVPDYQLLAYEDAAVSAIASYP